MVSVDRERQSSGTMAIQASMMVMEEFSGITDGVDEDGGERRRGILMGKDSNLSWGHVVFEVPMEPPLLMFREHRIKHWKWGSGALKRSQKLGLYLRDGYGGDGNWRDSQVEAKKASQGKSGSRRVQ